MKNFLIILSVVTFLSCKKEHPLNPIVESFTENNVYWLGFKVIQPITTVNADAFIGYNIAQHYEFLDLNLNRSIADLGTKSVFIVGVDIPTGSYLSTEQAISQLAERGWKPAPLSYALAINRDHYQILLDSHSAFVCFDELSTFKRPDQTESRSNSFRASYIPGSLQTPCIMPEYNGNQYNYTLHILCYRE